MRRIVVRRSPIDGRGVFALTNIQSGELLVEYKSEVTSNWLLVFRGHRICL